VIDGILAQIVTPHAPPAGFPAPGTEIFDYTKDCLVGSGQFCLTKVSLLMILSVVIILWVFVVGARKAQLVPRGSQNLVESFVDLVRANIVLEVMGPDGLPFLPFLTSIFLFVWVNNSFGIIPFLQFPTTARMAIPAFLAILVWFVFNIVGIVKQGGGHYLKNTLMPPGLPWWVYILYTPIEFVSVFLIRPLTLAVRLSANMIAGHLILTVFAIGTWYLFSHFAVADGLGKIVGVFSIPAFALQVFMTGFEVLVAFLQAFIFTILTAVYIAGAIHPEH
jgi:F-type H+-transporting ATPase subunit a